MTRLTNSLTVLADRVRSTLDESDAAEKTAIDKVLQAGGLLCEAKEACAHGEWLPFLERGGVPERKAQRYMKLARSGLKSDTVSDLGGIKAALRWAEGLKLPEKGECLAVSLDDFSEGNKNPLAIAWTESGGFKIALFNPTPGDAWIDLLVKPIIKTEFVFPAIYSLLGNRFQEMAFQIIPEKISGALLEATKGSADRMARA